MDVKTFMKKARKIIHAEQTKEEARFEARYFTRTRKLPFHDILCLMLDMMKTALQSRLNHFFECSGQKITMSEQALSKARNQFDHSPFEKMVRAVTESEYTEYSPPKWQGYHVLAVDGSTAQIPDTPQTREKFGVLGRTPGHACVGMSILYDVLNTWVVNPVFTSAAMNERAELMKHIAYLSENLPHVLKSSLFLLDRGYPAAWLLKKLEQSGAKYLCRCSKNFLSVVNNAPRGDSVVEHKSRKLRVYKFLLPTGEEETLVTNLFDEDSSDFPALYFRRWNIETAYGTLKNKLCVENFSGKTVNSILQDLWASMVLMNLVSTMNKETTEKVRSERAGKSNKYEYAPNIGAMVVSLREDFIFCCLRNNSCLGSLRLSRLVSKIARCVLPIRPGRSSPRPSYSNEKLRFPLNLKSHL